MNRYDENNGVYPFLGGSASHGSRCGFSAFDLLYNALFTYPDIGLCFYYIADGCMWDSSKQTYLAIGGNTGDYWRCGCQFFRVHEENSAKYWDFVPTYQIGCHLMVKIAMFICFSVEQTRMD